MNLRGTKLTDIFSQQRKASAAQTLPLVYKTFEKVSVYSAVKNGHKIDVNSGTVITLAQK